MCTVECICYWCTGLVAIAPYALNAKNLCAQLGGFAIKARVWLLWQQTCPLRNVSLCSGILALWQVTGSNATAAVSCADNSAVQLYRTHASHVAELYPLNRYIHRTHRKRAQLSCHSRHNIAWPIHCTMSHKKRGSRATFAVITLDKLVQFLRRIVMRSIGLYDGAYCY